MTSGTYNLGFVAFNNPQEVEAMISSLKEWDPKGLNRCLLVDHSSSKDDQNAICTMAEKADWQYDARLNLGFGVGVNHLVSMSSECDVLVLLNLDVRFCSKPPFGKMAAAVHQKSFSLVGTTLLNEAEQKVAGRLPPLSLKILFHDFGKYDHGLRSSTELIDEVVPWGGPVHGACFAVSTREFIRTGGIDESLFLYGEEFDLYSKLHRQKSHVGFLESHAIVHHSEGRKSLPLAFLNAYNLRYLAFLEHKYILSVFLTLRMVKLLLEVAPKISELWMALLRNNMNRQALLQTLDQSIQDV